MLRPTTRPHETRNGRFTHPARLAGLAILILAGVLWFRAPHAEAAKPAAMATKSMPTDNLAHATFAGGCFWCMEPPFEKIPGVSAVISGYSGGNEVNPTYEDVGGGKTGHTEVVDIAYDPSKVSFATLVEIFWRSMNPTDAGGQFADRGSQYRPALFYRNAEQKRVIEESKAKLAASGKFNKPIVVEVTAFKSFYAAEEYHQDFYKKDPGHYKAYSKGSGRQGFLNKTWGKDYPEAPVIPVTKDNDGVEEAKRMGTIKKYERPSDAELKKKLSSEQYSVTQKNGTERPFHNAYWDNHKEGLYVDVTTGEPLFSSKDKFESGTGWPSFTKPVDADALKKASDASHGMQRDEVRSRIGDAHLGHVFDDGPAPTGLRYCMNSAALRFIAKEKLVEEGYGEFAKLFEGMARH
ncbi:MAG: peptide-methionine (R)-S-oxide reductase MsrB [Fibrobacterota bacterium]|nr:peptide-methionine (R)-S-oxide reductase MsrB [Fibrobacterota bacterium]